MSEIITVGLDLAKNVFQVRGANASGRAVLRTKLRRDQVLEFFGRLSSRVVAMEACGGAQARHSRVQSSTTANDPEAATIGQLVGHELERPALVQHQRQRHRDRRADSPLAPAPMRHMQPFLTGDAEQALVIDLVPLAP